MARRPGGHTDRELSAWLDRNGYHHAHATKVRTPHLYAVSPRMAPTTRGSTVAATKAAIRATGASVKYQDSEWQVNVPRGTEATAYYTSDSEDAIGTARALMERARGHAHARMIESPATGRKIYGTKERGHHITTYGRQSLSTDQFALPPGPEEKQRGIKGRLPIDTIKRARNALQRAAQMKKRGHISASKLATVKRKVHAHWPSITSSS